MSGLHQHTQTTTISLTDVWEPKVEGLEPIETKRLAPGIEIVLAKQPFDGSVPVPEQDAAEAAAELEALESGLDTGAPPGRARGGGRGGRPRGGRGSRAPDGEAPPPVVRGGRCVGWLLELGRGSGGIGVDLAKKCVGAHNELSTEHSFLCLNSKYLVPHSFVRPPRRSKADAPPAADAPADE